MALDIIARDKKEIRWKGLPITCKKDVEEIKVLLLSASPLDLFLFCSPLSVFVILIFVVISYSYLQRDRNKVMNSVQKKAVFLKELREKVFLFLYVKRKSKCKTLTLRDLVMTFLASVYLSQFLCCLDEISTSSLRFGYMFSSLMSLWSGLKS